jgi:hypothetical protein
MNEAATEADGALISLKLVLALVGNGVPARSA